MDYGGLIRAHINHTSTCVEEIGGIIGYGGIKGLGWRARLVVFALLEQLRYFFWWCLLRHPRF